MAHLVGGWGNEDGNGILHPLQIVSPFTFLKNLQLKNSTVIARLFIVIVINLIIAVVIICVA